MSYTVFEPSRCLSCINKLEPERFKTPESRAARCINPQAVSQGRWPSNRLSARILNCFSFLVCMLPHRTRDHHHPRPSEALTLAKHSSSPPVTSSPPTTTVLSLDLSPCVICRSDFGIASACKETRGDSQHSSSYIAPAARRGGFHPTLCAREQLRPRGR